MNGRSVSVLKMALIVGLAGACGEPEVSSLTYDDVSKAAQGRDAAAYRSYFADIRGQRVAWSGRVVEVKTEHGDEFMEVGVLVVDLDGVAPEEDAILQVSAGARVIQVFDSWVGALGPDDYVRFVAPYSRALIERIRSTERFTALARRRRGCPKDECTTAVWLLYTRGCAQGPAC